MHIDLDHLRTWIGREEQASELLTGELVRRFNATLNRDSETAEGSAAPSLIHLCMAPPAAPMSQLGSDGHPARGGFLPPVPLPRRMWAGGEFIFHDDIRIGETVERRSVIRDVALKQGRSGALCFVTVEHRISSGGRDALTERQDIVYRSAETGGPTQSGKPGATAPAGRYSRTLTPTATLLFRYSALTFNGHRIHYDAPYAREVEGYPGLVVHGPMQATWLVHLAEELRGSRPRVFSFRSLSPLFDNADLTLNAEDNGQSLKLWTARAGGPVAMQASAVW